MTNLTWSAPEYEEQEKSTDWFWALGVVAITGALTAFIFGNFFFGILILLSGSLLYVFARKSPDLIEYELNDKGLRIKSHIYLYKYIGSFWVDKTEPPHLFIRTERFFMPVISIPIDREHENEIENIFVSNKVAKEEMKHHPAEKIIERLGL